MVLASKAMSTITGQKEPLEDEQMNQMTYMIRNSNPGGLRPSTRLYGYVASPQY